ncbi:hypothetical protein Adt_11436 [Abeliophyllum distichum]|uniref:Uncharacterized protein n=1 Tax=Abeliophyllum distichum TaxID=126358 RepID=A0ABD1UMX8_9LAMI
MLVACRRSAIAQIWRTRSSASDLRWLHARRSGAPPDDLHSCRSITCLHRCGRTDLQARNSDDGSVRINIVKIRPDVRTIDAQISSNLCRRCGVVLADEIGFRAWWHRRWYEWC